MLLLVTAEGWGRLHLIATSVAISICISNAKPRNRHKQTFEGAWSHEGPSAGDHGQLHKQYCFQQGMARGALIVFSTVSLPLP